MIADIFWQIITNLVVFVTLYLLYIAYFRRS